MEVKIGVQNASRELSIDTTLDADGVEKAVSAALADGGVLALTDTKGRRLVIPGDKLAYVDISTSVTGTVGFRSWTRTPPPTTSRAGRLRDVLEPSRLVGSDATSRRRGAQTRASSRARPRPACPSSPCGPWCAAR